MSTNATVYKSAARQIGLLTGHYALPLLETEGEQAFRAHCAEAGRKNMLDSGIENADDESIKTAFWAGVEEASGVK